MRLRPKSPETDSSKRRDAEGRDPEDSSKELLGPSGGIIGNPDRV